MRLPLPLIPSPKGRGFKGKNQFLNRDLGCIKDLTIPESEKQKLRTNWARLEALVGTEKRIGMVAGDLVSHFERRLEAMDGKALTVCINHFSSSL